MTICKLISFLDQPHEVLIIISVTHKKKINLNNSMVLILHIIMDPFGYIHTFLAINQH